MVETFRMPGWLQHHASEKSKNNLLVKTVDKKKKDFQCLRTKCGLKIINKTQFNSTASNFTNFYILITIVIQPV